MRILPLIVILSTSEPLVNVTSPSFASEVTSNVETSAFLYNFKFASVSNST